jgi:hypothetical protein
MPGNNFAANKIYNLYETDNSNDHIPPKIVWSKGNKQVGNVTSVSQLLLL